MKFNQIILFNKGNHKLQKPQLDKMNLWCIQFINAHYKDIIIDKKLKICLQDKMESIANVHRISSEPDVIYINIRLTEFEKIILCASTTQSNELENSFLHELTHIRNIYKYGLGEMTKTSSSDEVVTYLSKYLLDEYLAYYESNKKYPAQIAVDLEKEWFDQKERIISNHLLEKREKVKKLFYIDGMLLALKHLQLGFRMGFDVKFTFDEFSILNQSENNDFNNGISENELLMTTEIGKKIYNSLGDINVILEQIKDDVGILTQIYMKEIN